MTTWSKAKTDKREFAYPAVSTSVGWVCVEPLTKEPLELVGLRPYTYYWSGATCGKNAGGWELDVERAKEAALRWFNETLTDHVV